MLAEKARGKTMGSQSSGKRSSVGEAECGLWVPMSSPLWTLAVVCANYTA